MILDGHMFAQIVAQPSYTSWTGIAPRSRCCAKAPGCQSSEGYRSGELEPWQPWSVAEFEMTQLVVTLP